MPRSAARRAGAALVAIALAGAIGYGAVASQRSTSEAPPTEVGLARAHAGLCQSADIAEGGDADRARGFFLSRSHQQLHQLASAVARIDRSLSARLLEAKAKVEGDFDTSPTRLPGHLRRLADVTADAVVRTGLPRPTCP